MIDRKEGNSEHHHIIERSTTTNSDLIMSESTSTSTSELITAPPTPPPPSMPPSHDAPSNIFFPPYLLQDLFEHLDPLDLVACKQVCTLWYSIIWSRRRLRQKLFLPVAEKGSTSHLVNSPDEVYDLHPIFNLIHFDSSLDPASTTFGRQKCAPLKESAVKDHYATYPATARVEIDVIRFHPHLVVENETGVTVWDVIEELAK